MRRLKPGDILELKTPRGLAYLQYVGRHVDYGDVIWVLKGFHQARPAEPAELVGGRGYYIFYPAQVAARRGFVEAVATGVPLPNGMAVPRDLRWGGADMYWVISRNGVDTVRQKLTAAEKRLPLLEMWNHEFLVGRVTEEWDPSQDV
jgi:hypothetical protein